MKILKGKQELFTLKIIGVVVVSLGQMLQEIILICGGVLRWLVMVLSGLQREGISLSFQIIGWACLNYLDLKK